MTNLQKVIGGTSYPIAYQYNYAGELKQTTYPSGRIVAQTFDPIGRLSQLQVNGANYLSSLSYNAAGEALGFTYGNGVQATVSYNSQMQLASLAYAKSGSTLFSLTYNYGSGNNGQIQSITDNVDSTRTNTFTYDPWSRLKTASNTQWSISETYDRYGNRNAQTAPVNFSQVANPVTNRLPSPYAYDAAGNMTNDGLNTLVYDAESRSISSANGGASGAYVYDGNGLRVTRCLPNYTSPTTTTVYIFSGSKVIAEYDNGAPVASPSREFIYSATKLLATVSGGATTYHHPDHLSVRVSTDSGGNIARTFGHFPFGEVWYETGTPSKWKFTSYERDSESGNDYAMARFYVNPVARFSSPDPRAGSVADPQSLNRYVYALNAPTSLTDTTGLSPTGGPACLLDENGNCQGGGGGGSCTIDGFAADCGLVSGLLQADAAAQCQNNLCSGVNGNGQFVQYVCGSGGACGYLSLEQMSGGINEINGMLLTNAQFNQYILQNFADSIESQKDEAATKLAELMGISYTDAYALLDTGDGFLKGGNWNFQIDPDSYNQLVGTPQDPGLCPGGRCPDGLHFTGDTYVHLDTANPFGSVGGFVEHTLVDVLGGNTVWWVIPRH